MGNKNLSAFKKTPEPEIEKEEKRGVFKETKEARKPKSSKRIGRPPKQAEEKHNKPITVYFTSSDYEKLKALSKKRFNQPLAKLIYDQLKEGGTV